MTSDRLRSSELATATQTAQLMTMSQDRFPTCALFLVTFAVLLGQHFFVSVVGQPYPAIVMPAFNGNEDFRHGQLVVTRYEIVLGTSLGESFCDPSQLLASFPRAYHSTILSHCFAFHLPLPAEDRSSKKHGRARPHILYSVSDLLFPGFSRSRCVSNDESKRESFKEWLINNVSSVVTDDEVAYIEFRQYASNVAIDHPGHVTSDALVAMFRIYFE